MEYSFNWWSHEFRDKGTLTKVIRYRKSLAWPISYMDRYSISIWILKDSSSILWFGKQFVPLYTYWHSKQTPYYFQFDFRYNPLNIAREKFGRLIYQQMLYKYAAILYFMQKPFSWGLRCRTQVSYRNESAINLWVKMPDILYLWYTMLYLRETKRILCNAWIEQHFYFNNIRYQF